MQKFVRQLLTEWRKLNLPFAGKNIIIAVSGGADSCALLFAMNDLVTRKKINNRFIVAHYNHNLRGVEAKEDAEFVRGFAKELGLEFVTETAKDGEINNKANTEESARNARYNFLLRTAKKKNAHSVLTAHTINDQAETFLLNLLRGSGSNGLSAMQAIRKLSSENEYLLIRPFLNWAFREDIESFVKNNEIQFRNDSMNNEFNFKRVQIRKDLIPLLKKINPRILETLRNTTQILNNENELIQKFLSSDSEFNELINSDCLTVTHLINLPDAMVYEVLREWIRIKIGTLKGIELVHLKAIVKLINSRKSGRLVELPNFYLVKKQNGVLIFQECEVEK